LDNRAGPGAGGAAVLRRALKFRERPGRVPQGTLVFRGLPHNAKNAVAPQFLARLRAECPNVVGVKDSSMDFATFIRFKMVAPSDFCILMGNDAQTPGELWNGWVQTCLRFW